MECNGILAVVTKEDIIKQLSAETAEYYEKFMQCSSCHKIYWEGSHHAKMLEYIKKSV